VASQPWCCPWWTAWWIPRESRLRGEPRRLEEPAQHRDAVEVEAELGSDQRSGKEDERHGERDPQAVAARVPRLLRDSEREHERDSERETDGRDGVERLGVEVRLVDREVHDRAEHDRSDSRQAQPAVEPRPHETDERDPDQGEREVQRNELPPETRRDAVVVDVVELSRREPRVRGDDRSAVDQDQRHDGPGLPGDAL
jgi:hypothetical protein